MATRCSNWLPFKNLNFSLIMVIIVSIAKSQPSNKCAGGHFMNDCSINKIWGLTVALMSAVWMQIDSCDWQLAHLLLSLAPGLMLSHYLIKIPAFLAQFS